MLPKVDVFVCQPSEHWSGERITGAKLFRGASVAFIDRIHSRNVCWKVGSVGCIEYFVLKILHNLITERSHLGFEKYSISGSGVLHLTAEILAFPLVRSHLNWSLKMKKKTFMKQTKKKIWELLEYKTPTSISICFADIKYGIFDNTLLDLL